MHSEPANFIKLRILMSNLTKEQLEQKIFDLEKEVEELKSEISRLSIKEFSAPDNGWFYKQLCSNPNQVYTDPNLQNLKSYL